MFLAPALNNSCNLALSWEAWLSRMLLRPQRCIAARKIHEIYALSARHSNRGHRGLPARGASFPVFSPGAQPSTERGHTAPVTTERNNCGGRRKRNFWKLMRMTSTCPDAIIRLRVCKKSIFSSRRAWSSESNAAPSTLGTTAGSRVSVTCIERSTAAVNFARILRMPPAPTIGSTRMPLPSRETQRPIGNEIIEASSRPSLSCH